MNFIDWNYNTMIGTEYERRGECNQCGTCCKTTINIRMVDGDKTTHGGVTTDGIDRWSEVPTKYCREFVKFYMPTLDKEEEPARCSALGFDNQCVLHDYDKPWVCQVWPTAPSDIIPFKKCSYEFVEVDNWAFEDNE